MSLSIFRAHSARTSIRRPIIAAILLTIALAPMCFAQDAARMEQIVRLYTDGKQFMGTVLVAKDGKIVFDKAYGSADLEWNVPNAPDTKFRLGSITKQFTAASILLLEERGKLSTDDLVKKHMPDAPAAWDKITIYHVLTHTSGIPSFTSFPDYRPTQGQPTTPEKLVARFRDKPLDFEPGEKWNYSNSGYVLLGYLIEKISGQKYKDFVQENIFKPLAMNDSGYDSNTAIIPRRAAGYTPTPAGPRNADYIDMTIPLSAGALYSTTHDLLLWEEGLFGGKVISAASLKKMTTPFKQDYAFGLSVHTVNGHKVIEHGGGIDGFNTHLSYYPDDKLTVVALANLNGLAVDTMSPKLAAVAFGEKIVLPSERKEVPVPTDVLATYVGTYQLAPTFSIVITLEGDKLMAQATGQGKLQAFPESPTRFFYKAVDAQIEFNKDAQGRVTSLTLFQNGREIKGEKK
jgi:CubicO group peptidase (beta-lactamase class C family)